MGRAAFATSTLVGKRNHSDLESLIRFIWKTFGKLQQNWLIVWQPKCSKSNSWPRRVWYSFFNLRMGRPSGKFSITATKFCLNLIGMAIASVPPDQICTLPGAAADEFWDSTVALECCDLLAKLDCGSSWSFEIFFNPVLVPNSWEGRLEFSVLVLFDCPTLDRFCQLKLLEELEDWLLLFTFAMILTSPGL